MASYMLFSNRILIADLLNNFVFLAKFYRIIVYNAVNCKINIKIKVFKGNNGINGNKGNKGIREIHTDAMRLYGKYGNKGLAFTLYPLAFSL